MMDIVWPDEKTFKFVNCWPFVVDSRARTRPATQSAQCLLDYHRWTAFQAPNHSQQSSFAIQCERFVLRLPKAIQKAFPMDNWRYWETISHPYQTIAGWKPSSCRSVHPVISRAHFVPPTIPGKQSSEAMAIQCLLGLQEYNFSLSIPSPLELGQQQLERWSYAQSLHPSYSALTSQTSAALDSLAIPHASFSISLSTLFDAQSALGFGMGPAVAESEILDCHKKQKNKNWIPNLFDITALLPTIIIAIPWNHIGLIGSSSSSTFPHFHSGKTP